MNVAAQRYRYAAVAIALHWAIAVLLVILVAIGWWMTRGEGASSAAPGTLKFEAFQLHKALGILVLLLTLARVGWRLFNPPPPSFVIVLPWEKALASAVYFAFYVLMVALPLTGWALVSSSPTGIPTLLFGVIEWPHLPLPTTDAVAGAFDRTHAILAWTTVALIGLHIAGALKHQIIDGENILVRMAPGLFGRAERPATAARGLPVAVAAPIALGFVVLVAPLVADTATRPPVSDQAFAQVDAGGWMVDTTTSAITFTGSASGSAFEGRFQAWNAEIVFDPADLPSARIVATIDVSSATTGNSYWDSSMLSGSWLDATTHPQAVFTMTSVAAAGAGAYQAEGTLELKGVTAPVTLPFTLTIDGDAAHAEGSFALDRRAFAIGTDTTQNDSSVTPEIMVTITVDATRAGGA